MNRDQTRKASIIITTHNRPHLLPQAVISARASGTDVEIVVVDDASTDETANVCRGLSDIVYLRVERNQQVAGARNIGVVASRGEYISFLDDDDTRIANSLDQQIAILEKEPAAGMIYGQAIVGNQQATTDKHVYPSPCPQGDVFWQLVTRNFVPCGSAVFRRSCLSRVGMVDDKIPGVDDWDLWVRIAEIYPVIALETPLIVWRRSTPASGQGTSRAAELVTLSVRKFREWMKSPRAANASPKTRRAAWHSFSENMTEHLIWEAARSLNYGMIQQALRDLLTIPRLEPLTVLRVAKHRLVGFPRTKFPDSLAWRNIQS